MTHHGGQDPPDRRAKPDEKNARECLSPDHDGDVLPLRDQPKATWWDETLRHLGDDILAESVPERLRSVLSTRTKPSPEKGRSGSDGRDTDDS